MSLLGSAAINQGRHIGLQQLEAMSTFSRSFLGPNKRYKLIQDEASGEATLVWSCCRLLEQLELSDSVGQLLTESTRAQREALHSGTASLVFLAGIWSRVALECLHKGIPIPHIMAGLSKGLELCVEGCRYIAVTVEVVCKAALQKQELGGMQLGSCDCMTAAFGVSSLTAGEREITRDTVKTLNEELKLCSVKEKLPPKRRINLRHSRHFQSSDSSEAEGARSMASLYAQDSKGSHLVQLAEAVSHGCETSMNLVIEASRIQCRHSSGDQSSTVLDVDKLATCLLPGLSEENSCVFHGYVILLCAEQASVAKHFEDRELKISIVNGDLSEHYYHIGFNRPKKVTKVCDLSHLAGVSQKKEWVDQALRIVRSLSIDILLVSGVVTQQLKDHCLSHNILVIEHARASILKAFSTTTGALPISYVTQLSERCVGAGVRVNVLREYCGAGKTQKAVVSVDACGMTLATAVLASSVHAKLQSLEDQFWSCAYRMHHALKDGKLLPGAGETELLCIHQLYKHMGKTSPEKQEREDELSKARQTEETRWVAPYEQVVLQLMAEGWMDYISTLLVNCGQVVTKAQAWTYIAQQLRDWDKTPHVLVGAPLKRDLMDTMQGKRGTEEKRMLERESEMVGVYDNMTVKFETWRRALDLVFLVLQTDTEIITGINDRQAQDRDFMFL
ncbi:chaperonin-containing T-complex member BBS12 [Brachyhypopomus gauderio]|uniref:chaperonin-containing T-complex member BBS12 n=1 Tax=Brachyhypopomus gauderio TaxID=698409 RepID=UPI0040420C91